ncbi:glutamyl-tRNA synthetase [Aquiflexum balticum DSM 16537]|uniref:Glutamyl-tRNA synthetase n=1 Tax=Aquiflexum balticum DSM 16537 TaxID=758820 RepID=A0A1W2H9I0_9BACT|nr:glutamate--tRNA ligase family protein [Aquiflexum balticum]SMD45543.1 glutamyl-tRNA synthetase [Aquiflexum balticum DSM 16537]
MTAFKLTRYAPTPSGFLHLGNIYSFILTYHLAKKHQARILLRIDDMDRERVKTKFIQDIFDNLDFMELPYDLGPKNAADFKANYSQTKRLDLYVNAMENLKKNKKLFACDCSRKKIEKMNPKGFYTGFCRNRNLPYDNKEVAWRYQADMHQDIRFKDLHEGHLIGKLPGILTDFIVRKKDGLPAYQLTSVVDDLHFGVDLIVRGKDLWGSTLAQVLLSDALEPNTFSQNTFYHHPLIQDPNRQKLSKSAGATSIQFLRKSGKKKEDVYSMIGEWLGIREKINSLDAFGKFV